MTSSKVHVLNINVDFGEPRPPGSLALELQKTMLKLKGQYMSADGREVKYGELRGSQLFAEYEVVARQLGDCDLGDLQEESDKKAFFINIYNALTVHGLAVATPLPTSVLELDQFWANTAYNIGGHVFSLDDIEHGILRGNRPHPSVEQPPFTEDDPRRKFALATCDARIHFALVCGAKSCPAIQVYSSSNIDRALTMAAQSFCSQEVAVNETERTVTVSKIFHWYARDFGTTEREMLKWLCQYVPEETRGLLEQMLSTEASITVKAKEYNWQLNSERSLL
jgi:hypothetical protein